MSATASSTGDSVMAWSRPTTEAAPPKARGGHTATLVGTDLVVFGGHSSTGSGTFTYYDDTFALNLENNTWHKVRTGGDKPSARYGHTASLVGQRIYVFGGRGEDGAVFKDLYFLDTSSWCWVRVSTTSPAAPRARFNHAAALVGNKIVISGGWDGKNCYDDLWVFDTDSLIWIKPQMGGRGPTRRHGHTIQLTKSGHLIVFGGCTISEQGLPQYLGDVRFLDIETMVWDNPRVSADVFPEGRFLHTACMMGSYMLIFGGYTGPTTVNSDRITIAVSPDHPLQQDHVLALDCDNLCWVRPNNIGKMPLTRYGHVMVEAGTQLIVFGGWGSNRALNDICVVEAFGCIADSVNCIEHQDSLQEQQQESSTAGYQKTGNDQAAVIGVIDQTQQSQQQHGMEAKGQE